MLALVVHSDFRNFEYCNVILYPGDMYLLKVNNGNNQAMCEICLKLTISTPE